MKKEELIALYGTDNVDEIIKKKTENRQDKVFASRKPKRVEMTATECKKLCEKVGLEYLDGYEGRVIEHVISDETVDRDGDILRAKGADFKTNYYPKNPTILFAHEGRNFPVGKSIKIWHDAIENNVKSQGLYFDDRMDRTGRADTVFRMVAGGGMPACSVGFNPIKANRPKNEQERQELGLGDYGIEFQKWEVLEYSPCAVGSNPNALQNMIKALKSKKDCQQALDTVIPKAMIDDFIQAAQKEYKDFTATIEIKPEEEIPPEEYETVLDFYDKTEELTEEILKPFPNEHACRLKDPNKYDKFRRKKRDSDGKTYNVIFGKLKGEDKWEEQAYRYPKDGWTPAEAKKHCKGHNGVLFEPASETTAEINEKLLDGVNMLINEVKNLSGYIKELNSTLEPLKDLKAGDSDDDSSGKPPDNKKAKELYRILEEEGNAIQL